MQTMTAGRLARGLARRLGLNRVWIPGIRPYRLVQEGKALIPCHACGELRFRPFIRDPGHQVVTCVSCGLYYVNPVPVEAALIERVEHTAAYTEDQLLKRVFFRRRAEELLERVEKLITPGRLLDIGCAIGTELAVAGSRGWDATGIELSESSVGIARQAGLYVLSVPLSASDLADGSFDLITMNHVLEHVAHTPTFMGDVRRILSERGLLFLSVPNVHAWKFYLRRGSYAWTFHGDHYIHFSVKTLPMFLGKHGFEVLEISTSRWLDFHDPVKSRSRLFRTINRAAEQRDLGIEIFCLARLAVGQARARPDPT